MSLALRMVSAVMANAHTVDVRKMLREERLGHFVIDTMIAKIPPEHVVLGLYKTLFILSLDVVPQKQAHKQIKQRTKKQKEEMTENFSKHARNICYLPGSASGRTQDLGHSFFPYGPT